VRVDKVLTPVLGGVALLIGLWQWRAARQEASLERYFDRLEVPNQRWCEYYQHVIELLAEAPRETPGCRSRSTTRSSSSTGSTASRRSTTSSTRSASTGSAT
jgi:hypothetical protein